MIIACIISFIVGAMAMMCAIGLMSYQKVKKPRNKVHFYVARDKNEELWVYTLQPYKSLGDQWECTIGCKAMSINPNLLPEVKWSDEEPTKVKLVIQK